MEPNYQGQAFQPTTGSQSAPAVQYAGFGIRFVAMVIDIIVISFAVGILGMVLGVANFSFSEGEFRFSNPLQLLACVYQVIMDVKFGGTIGKLALGLRVQNADTGANLSWLEAFLREVVGRVLSSLVLGLGYLWVIWDPKKQGWHDKIAKSVVVKVK